MLRTACFAAFFTVLALGSDSKPPDATTETIVAQDEDILPLHASQRETTLIVLPASEKAMGVFCGDKTYWNVDVIPGAERYVAVKPSKAGISTDHFGGRHKHRWLFERRGVGRLYKHFQRHRAAASFDRLKGVGVIVVGDNVDVG